jgi:hypothetical protein
VEYGCQHAGPTAALTARERVVLALRVPKVPVTVTVAV